MGDLVTYEKRDGIATITMDDGKANVMTLPMIDALGRALDRALDDGAVAILTGRSNVFSAGYDLAVFNEPGEVIVATMRAGGELVERLLSHPMPVVAACNGHAIAQGAFTLLACDVRIGVGGDCRIGLNEVAIGLTIPHYGVEIARHQLNSAWFDHATLTGTFYGPADAVRAGFLHDVVEPAELASVAYNQAEQLTQIDFAAHSGTLERVRKDALASIAHGVRSEFGKLPSAPEG